ncbi:DNA repair protein Nse1 [Aureobasidium pullulans]|uniref:Non-structural maintenance of chromosomes element 1 homolog n=1 Tax=Aureobasidium pullulans TaxID=5580 RepID=A0A4S9LR52_AURPU|nr:DNA repair protein Nse1 [Aureobasidium pullulans]
MSQNGEDDDVYNNSHRAFLQSFLSRATLTFEEARPILAAIKNAQDGRDIQSADITEEDVSTYINVTNAAISPFDLEIRNTLSQHDRTRIYALVNVSSDSITQLATTHTPDEISWVKRCLDAIFETNNTHRSEVLAIKSTEALRLAKAPANQHEEATQGAQAQSLTMMQAQRMLQAMVDEGWFEHSKKDFYTLTPRALMELRGWLVETYNDDEDERIKTCSACKSLITMVALADYTTTVNVWPSELKTTMSVAHYARRIGTMPYQWVRWQQCKTEEVQMAVPQDAQLQLRPTAQTTHRMIRPLTKAEHKECSMGHPSTQYLPLQARAVTKGSVALLSDHDVVWESSYSGMAKQMPSGNKADQQSPAYIDGYKQ